ncbi:MAG: hypothetical protein VKJ04_07755 [Vampirovibrionales bacterium]|nr:hypothetical protein [Vampirovibrionales bacterium]
MDQDKIDQDKRDQDKAKKDSASSGHQHSHDCKPSKRATPGVLKFKRRLYDGGNEAELVNTMERYYQAMTMAQTMPLATELARHTAFSEIPGEHQPGKNNLHDSKSVGTDSALGDKGPEPSSYPTADKPMDASHLQRLEALKPLVEAAEAESRAALGRHLKVVGGSKTVEGNKTKSSTKSSNVTPLPSKKAKSLENGACQSPEKTKPAGRLTKAGQALILGPLEITVSILGSITAGFALLTFFYFKNPQLHAHSWTVMHECKRTFVRGLRNCVLGPGRSLGHLLGKKAR